MCLLARVQGQPASVQPVKLRPELIQTWPPVAGEFVYALLTLFLLLPQSEGNTKREPWLKRWWEPRKGAGNAGTGQAWWGAERVSGRRIEKEHWEGCGEKFGHR